MDSGDRKATWKQNLSAMKENLQKTYDFRTLVQEESKLIAALRSTKRDYVIFSDYRRNEGRRRFEDVKDLIEDALIKIDCCNSDDALLVYFSTLKEVSRQTRWSKVLESLSKYSH
ncbi:MAG: hypothetical protein ACFFF9_06190 [Candidatus Thorarchaeota archaeon]